MTNQGAWHICQRSDSQSGRSNRFKPHKWKHGERKRLSECRGCSLKQDFTMSTPSSTMASVGKPIASGPYKATQLVGIKWTFVTFFYWSSRPASQVCNKRPAASAGVSLEWTLVCELRNFRKGYRYLSNGVWSFCFLTVCANYFVCRSVALCTQGLCTLL